MESSEIWATDGGSCSEAPEGPTGQDPVGSRKGGTPLNGEDHPPCSQATENLEVLTEKVSSLGLRFPKKIAAVLPKSGRGNPGWRSLPLGPLTADNLRPPLVVSSRDCQALALLWLVRGQPLRNRNPQNLGDVPMDRRSDRGRPGALWVTVRLRGPNRLGSLVMPERLRRASGWPSYTKAILENKSLGITS